MFRHLRMLSLVSFSVAWGLAHGELVDGPANIRDAPGGNIIASIDDGATVIEKSFDNDWFRIEIPVTVKIADLIPIGREHVMPKGTRLLGGDSTPIGRLMTTMPVPQDAISIDTKEAELWFAIEGFTFKNNIRPNSRVEARVEGLLKKGKFLMGEGWGELVKEQYISSDANDEFSSYLYSDYPGGSIHGRVRLVLYFFGDRLFSIFHMEEIEYPDFEYGRPFMGGVLHYMPGFNEAINSQFEREFVGNEEYILRFE